MPYIGSLPLVTNRETFEQPFEFIDADVGGGFNLSSATIVFEISDPDSGTRLSATNSDGVDMTDAATGIIVVSFSVDDMRTLCGKEYDVGITVQVGDFVAEPFVGKQPVIDGIVT